MTKSVLALATIHIGIVAGSKGDKLRGQSPTPPKTVIAKTGTVFTPRTDKELSELLATKSVRTAAPGEDFSRYPYLDLDTGESSEPVRKSQAEIDEEKRAAKEAADHAEQLRLEQVEKAKKAAQDQQDADDKAQRDADDKMRAEAKKNEEKAAADQKKKELAAAKNEELAAAKAARKNRNAGPAPVTKAENEGGELDAAAVAAAAAAGGESTGNEQDTSGTEEQEDVV